MGSRVFAGLTLAFAGIILADILIHPQGTTAAGNAAAGILKPTYNALLGNKV
jgi:hypothetical protein